MNLHTYQKQTVRRTRIRGKTKLIIRINGDCVTKTRANTLIKGIEKAITQSGLGPTLYYKKDIRGYNEHYSKIHN